MKYHLFFLISLIGTTHSIVYANDQAYEKYITRFPSVVGTKLDDCLACHKQGLTESKESLNTWGKSIADAGLDFDKMTSVLSLPNKHAEVRFDHTAHMINPKYGINGQCSKCHGDGPEFILPQYDPNTVIRLQGHHLCKQCHRTANKPSAPTACADCHRYLNNNQ